MWFTLYGNFPNAETSQPDSPLPTNIVIAADQRIACQTKIYLGEFDG
jgi:hypothetical protein